MAASILETALGSAQSGIVQVLVRGRVGDLIFRGSNIALEDRILSGQAVALKKALSFVRATLPRAIFGLFPQGGRGNEGSQD